MQTYNVTAARTSLYNILNEVNENHEPVQITGKNGNAVVISEKDWKSIEETLCLYAVPDLVMELKESLCEDIQYMKSADEVEW